MLNYVKESFEELTQYVTWPSYAEAQRLMIIVVVFSALFSLFIAGVDIVFENVIALIFRTL